MQNLIKILQAVAKYAAMFSELIMKIPKPIWWAIGMIPGVKTLWAGLSGSRTILLNIFGAAVMFLETTDWTNISGWLCETLTAVFQVFNKSFVCDSSYIPSIAASLLMIANIALRILGNKTKG